MDTPKDESFAEPNKASCLHHLRRALVLIFLLTSAVAVLYAFENWRGNRAWNKYRQAAEARGEPMDIGALVTKSGPGDQGSEPPFAKELADFGRSPEQTGRLSNPDSSKSPDR